MENIKTNNLKILDSFNEELFETNILSLSVLHQEFCHKILKFEGDNNLDIAKVVKNEESLLVNGVQLTSLYKRLENAEYRCRNIDCSKNIVIYGFGLGDELGYLIEQAGNTDICIVILNPRLFIEILGRLENFSLLLKKNVHFLLPNENFEIVLNSVIVPVELYIEPTVYNKQKIALMNFIDDKYVSNKFNELNNSLNKKNLTENYEYLKNECPLVADDLLFLKERIIVVAPGPSLSNNIEILKREYTENTSIITVDVALNFLQKNQIIPDVIVTVDRFDNKEIALNFSKEHICKKQLLIFTANSPHFMTEMFLCKKRFIYKKRDTEVLDYLSPKHANFVLSQGSVLNTAVEIAVKSNPREINLFGVDFSFLDGITHAGVNDSGKYFEGPMTPMIVKCNDGAFRTTFKPYAYYMQLLEKTIKANPNVIFRNYSKTGAVIEGAILAE